MASTSKNKKLNSSEINELNTKKANIKNKQKQCQNIKIKKDQTICNGYLEGAKRYLDLILQQSNNYTLTEESYKKYN